MKKIRKRTIAALLAAVLLSGLLPGQVLAAEITQPGHLELNDGYLKVSVSTKNGGFLIDTVGGDKLNKADDNRFLLYPDGNYDTSYTSFRVTRGSEVRDYIFGRDYSYANMGSNGLSVEETDGGILSTWSIDGLTFTQNIILANQDSPLHGMVAISYSVKSTDGRAVDKVECRILMDTALGYQDYGVYEVSKENSRLQTVTNETVVSGSDYQDSFFAYNDPMSPAITAYTLNTVVDGKTVRPEKVAFGHWNNLASTVFDFTPDSKLDFTTQQNEKYLTADSAYALYFDMGAVPTGGAGKTISTNYGVFSNAAASATAKVAINMLSLPNAMELNAKKDAYLPQVGSKAGDFSISLNVKNVSASKIDALYLAVYPQEGIRPYDIEGNLVTNATYVDPYLVTILNLAAGGERNVTIKFNAVPGEDTDYRKISFQAQGTGLQDEELRETYLLCPSSGVKILSFFSTTPEALYTSGTRHLYLSGRNFNLLRNTAEYKVFLKPLSGRAATAVPNTNVFIDFDKNTADLVLDQYLAPGTYQVVFDWVDAAKADTAPANLRFAVSDNPNCQSKTFGVVTVEKEGDGINQYTLNAYRTEAEYKQTFPGNRADATVLLEFRGDFSLTYADDGKTLVKAEAVSLTNADGSAANTISISNCLDVEKGTLAISVENPGRPDQCINTDIDGYVYTTGARTKVWNGVCAISSIEDGSEFTLLPYKYDGEPDNSAQNSVANTNGITLLWPGAASGVQTLAGMLFELRYCQFGQISDKSGGAKRRVVTFGAELSPDFLVPSNFDWGNTQTSPMEVAQLKLASTNYTPSQLREVQGRYAADQAAWEAADTGSLAFYVHDILFGGGFIGFNTSLEVELPAYAEGLPTVAGTLDLKVINEEWAIGLKGSAELVALVMEAELRVRSNKKIPVPDKIYFFIASTPGINVDGMGILWLQGAGGGIDKLYDTLFSGSAIPPLTLLLSGQAGLFGVLNARGDVALGARGLSASISDLKAAGITLVDYAGIDLAWYPRIRFYGGIEIGILGIINGSGHILAEQNPDTGDFFWEGVATAELKIPKIPLIGEIKIGSAELGVNAEKIWGALHVIKLDMGVTYYWGGDVDFAFGKYDAPEPTVRNGRSVLSVPIYQDKSTGRTLFMAIPATASGTAVSSTADKLTHTVNLGTYGADDGVLYLTFPANSLAEAKKVVVDGYPLTWLDNSKNADDPANLNANALVSFDPATKEAMVTISFTDQAAFDKDWTVKTPSAAEVNTYAVERQPDLESLTYTVADDALTATWTGSELDELDRLNIYAENADGDLVLLGDTSTAGAGTLTITALADHLPSGTYTLRAAGVKTDSAAPAVCAATPFTYTNPKQPGPPTIGAVALGGDYSIDVSGLSATTYDSYLVNIYEVKDGSDVLTDLAGQLVSTPGVTLTVGGQYSREVYLNENGETVSTAGLTDEQIAALTRETETVGLEAGKTYRVGISGYKDGRCSAETKSSPILMTAPVKTAVTASLPGAVQMDGIDTVKSKNVILTLTADSGAVNGSWSVDGGLETPVSAAVSHTLSLQALEEGTHKLTFQGENATGDSVQCQYLFTVDTLPPRLQLSSPINGSFFGSGNLTVAGFSDAGATVNVSVEGTHKGTCPVTAQDGSFTMQVPLDAATLYHNVSITAIDSLGNISAPVAVKLVNEALGDANASLHLYAGDKDYTGKVIPANNSAPLSLKLATGDQIIDVNADDFADWQVRTVSGVATINADGSLTREPAAKGYVVGTLGALSAAALLEPDTTTDEPGGGGGGGSSSGMGTAPIVTNPLPTQEEPNPPTNAEISITGSPDRNGAVSVRISDQSIADAISAAQKQAGSNGISITANIVFSQTINSLSVTLSRGALDQLIAAKVRLFQVKSSFLSYGFDLEALKEIRKSAAAELTVIAKTQDASSLTESTRSKIGDRPAYAFSIISGGKAINSFGKGTASIWVPYRLRAGEQADVLWGLDANAGGEPRWLSDSVYLTSTGTLFFTVKRFSVYGIGIQPEELQFADVEGHWAKRDVEYVAARGLLLGTGKQLFSPDVTLTRGMFVTVLGRLAGIDTTQYQAGRFSDVDATVYYAPYIMWAADSGVASGTSATTFAPDKPITRQEMAVIMANYAKMAGYSLPENGNEALFVDSADIAPWAVDAVEAMRMVGIFGGKSGNRFDSMGLATRGEAAAVLRRFLELVVDAQTAF